MEIRRFDMERELTRMVDVSVRNDDSVDVRRGYRYLDVLEQIRALLHSAVYDDVLAAGLKKRAGTCDFVSCSDKRDFHYIIPPLSMDILSGI